MKKPALAAVFWDLDGTILDTLADLGDSLNFVLAERGFPTHSREAVRKMVGNGIPHLVKSALPADTPDALFRDTLAAMRARYALHRSDQTAPYPGITDLLDFLKERGVLSVVISNKPQEDTAFLCERFFPGKIDLALGARLGFPKKPDPALLEKALSAFGFSKDECVFIGDSEVDVLTAKNTKMRSIIVTWGFRDRDTLLLAGAKDMADSPDELRRKLEALF